MSTFSKPPTKLPWANSSTDVIEPADGVKASGWTAIMACPPFEWMNWILNWVSQGIRYIMAVGISDWDAAEDYGVGDKVKGTDNLVYECFVAHINHAPPSSSYWTRWGHTPAEIAAMMPVQSVTALTGLASITGSGTISGNMIKNGRFTEIAFGLSNVPYNQTPVTVTFTGEANAALNGAVLSAMVAAAANTAGDVFSCTIQSVPGDADHTNFSVIFVPGIGLGHVYSCTGRILAG